MTTLKKRLPLFLAIIMVAGMALSMVAPTAAKQTKPAKNEAKQPAAVVSATGKLVKVTAGDDIRYAVQDSAGKTVYYLEAGPKWYYGTGTYPLDKYAGQQVTVTGVVEQPKANKPAKNPKANQAPKTPLDALILEVYSVNNDKIRDAGKPPWAGGPKNNPNHPGNNGNGHANGKGKANAPGQNKDKGNKPVKP